MIKKLLNKIKFPNRAYFILLLIFSIIYVASLSWYIAFVLALYKEGFSSWMSGAITFVLLGIFIGGYMYLVMRLVWDWLDWRDIKIQKPRKETTMDSDWRTEKVYDRLVGGSYKIILYSKGERYSETSYNELNQMHGTCIHYYPDGKKKWITQYIEGNIYEIIHFDKEGNVEYAHTYYRKK